MIIKVLYYIIRENQVAIARVLIEKGTVHLLKLPIKCYHKSINFHLSENHPEIEITGKEERKEIMYVAFVFTEISL